MHTINRDNYETWLMLYLDNELAASERHAVEAFCAANPDVQDELEGLKDVLLQPDVPVAMPGKERLLMPETWNEEALTRQQEQLLMMADNALPAGDKVLLENEMETNPLLQKEWSILQKTVLEATIPAEMPGKASLFRREKARVIPFGRILRMAAAAAILGFGWFFTQELYNKNPKADGNAPELAVTGKTMVNSGQQQVNAPDVVENRIDSVAESNNNRQKELAAVTFEKSKAGLINKNKPAEPQKSVVEAPRDLVQSGNQVDQQTDLSNRDIVTKIPSVVYVDVAGVDAVESPSITQTVRIEPPITDVETKAMQAYELVNADDMDVDESISIAGARISKQKIRNVYRNITRPLARTFEKTPAPRTEVR